MKKNATVSQVGVRTIQGTLAGNNSSDVTVNFAEFAYASSLEGLGMTQTGNWKYVLTEKAARKGGTKGAGYLGCPAPIIEFMCARIEVKKIKKSAVAAALLLSFCTVASLSACGHTHELDKVSAQQAFCLKDGNIEYWECETCGKLFADENAETELAPEDIILPAGHKPELIPAETSDDVFTCTAREYYRKWG